MADVDKELTLDPRCSCLEGHTRGPFVHLDDDRILTATGNSNRISNDGGATWSPPVQALSGCGSGTLSAADVLVGAQDGTIVWAYLDQATQNWSWDESRKEAAKDSRVDVCCVRSHDQGATWSEPVRIFQGYCGAICDFIVTGDGTLVLPIQRLVQDPSHHAICVYTSQDSGATWTPSNVIDVGGHGHHDGAFEPTLIELGDGRLWMLIRTNLDCFWECFSDDRGKSWCKLQPTCIDASSAPGYLFRLQSGRLVMAWNRVGFIDGRTLVRRGGDCQLSASLASWQREELSLAFSEDDGRTWSEPVVVIGVKGGGPSYPYLFEPTRGRIWLSTQFGDRMIVKLNEMDFR